MCAFPGATAATNALSNEAAIAKVQEWLRHANVSTPRLYDRRKTKPGGQPDISHELLSPTDRMCRCMKTDCLERGRQ